MTEFDPNEWLKGMRDVYKKSGRRQSRSEKEKEGPSTPNPKKFPEGQERMLRDVIKSSISSGTERE